MNEDNNTMACGTFMKVGFSGETDKFTLKDIAVSGYDTDFQWSEDDDMWTGGCRGGDFVLKVLSGTGRPTATYYWRHYRGGDKEDYVDIGPAWATFDEVEEEYTDMTDAEMLAVTFDMGQAFWIEGAGLNLQAAGQVSNKDIEFVTREDNNTAVGNGTPAALTLGDVCVKGYDTDFQWSDDDDMWTGGCRGGDFVLKQLSGTGRPLATYYWRHYRGGDKEDYVDIGPAWATFDEVEEEYTDLTKEEMEAIPVAAGQGYWVEGAGMTLVFPAPEL